MIKLSKLHILLHQHIQAIRISVNQLSVSLFSTIITFAVIGIALALPMNLYVLLENIQTVTAKLHTTTQITLYLEKNIQPIQLNNTMRLLKNDIDIAQAQYISPEEGLKTFQKQLHTDHIIEEFKENPLPGVIIVQPIQQNQTTLKVNQLLDRLKRLPFVNDAQLDTIWLQRLNTIITLPSY